MSRKTAFAGLTALSPGESLTTDGGAFTDRDRDVIDAMLRIGAKTHRHNGAPPLANPTAAPVVTSQTTGGGLPADVTIAFVYTLLDGQGGETRPSTVGAVTTQPPTQVPTSAPSATISYTGGSLMAAEYAYVVTLTDGAGGETPAGPAGIAIRAAGHASGQVVITGLASIVATASATAWRLYRAKNGGDYDFLTTGTDDSITDDGSIVLDCGTVPPRVNTTHGTSRITVAIPSGAVSSGGASGAAGWKLYASTGSFASPSLLGGVRTIAEAATPIVISSLNVVSGAPPDVSTAIGGAYAINPEDLNLSWKAPVATVGALPALATEGDVRLVLADGSLHDFLGGSWRTVTASAHTFSLLDAWQGVWNPTRPYASGDVVYASGSTFLALGSAGVAFAPGAPIFTPAVWRGLTSVTALQAGRTYHCIVQAGDPSPTGASYKGKAVQFEVANPGTVVITAPAGVGGSVGTNEMWLVGGGGSNVYSGFIGGTFTLTMPSAGTYVIHSLVPPATTADTDFAITITSGTAALVEPPTMPGDPIPNDPPTNGATWALFAGGRPPVGFLASGATIATDAAFKDTFAVTLGGAATMSAPMNPSDGKTITYRIKQDATGSRVITWDAVFRFSSGLPQPTLSTAAAAEDYVSFKYNAAAGKWDCVAAVLGF